MAAAIILLPIKL